MDRGKGKRRERAGEGATIAPIDTEKAPIPRFSPKMFPECFTPAGFWPVFACLGRFDGTGPKGAFQVGKRGKKVERAMGIEPT